jgi:TatD DNase family protein
MMNLVDSHCHLDFQLFDNDRADILSHCQQLGISDIVIPGVTAEKWDRLLELCEQSILLHSALGLHPLFIDQHKAEHLLQLKKLIETAHPVAIGEIGLDFYLPNHDKQVQIALFTEQLKLAQSAQLPVLLHVRKAHDHTISLLKMHRVVGGIVHAFNGSLQQAAQYQKLGFLLGVGGVITHLKATRLRALFSQLPLSSIVLETDAPDMPLAEMHDQRNTPENIPIILAALATIRSESKQDIATISTDNAKRVLNIK